MRARNRLRLLAGLAAGVIVPAAAPRAAGEGNDLPILADWPADAREARKRRVPLVVLFSLPGCPYCEQVRRSHLGPMMRDPARLDLAIVRQVDINADRVVTSPAGERLTHAQIARSRGIRGAPVVQFWSPDGESIAEPLVGMLLPDFYGAYLEQSLEAATSKLATAR